MGSKMLTKESDFAWHEDEPGVWGRNIDELEHFYTNVAQLYSGSGRSFFHMTGHVSLSVNVPDGVGIQELQSKIDNSLKAAWIKLRHEQPCIAAEVTWDRKSGSWRKRYHALKDDHDVNAWVKKTFIKIDIGPSGNEWTNADPPAPGVPTLFLLRPNTDERTIRRDLVFRSPHDIVDGVGTLHMLQILLKYASDAYGSLESSSNVQGSPEIHRLGPCFRVAAAITKPLIESQQNLLKEILAATPPLSTVEAMSIPFKSGAKMPGKHQRVAQTLTTDQTAKLLTACKAENATVTHAFHAAIVMCMRDRQRRGQGERMMKYAGYILRNERNGCAVPYNTSQYAVGVYHSISGRPLVVGINVPAIGDQIEFQQQTREFKSIVAQMRDFYHEVHNDKDHIALAPYYLAKAIPELPASWDTSNQPLPVPAPKADPGVSISSMGLVDMIIDKENGPFEVHDPWVTGEELTNGLGCFLGTFRGQLTFSAAYNDAWHEKSEVEKFLRDCTDQVLTGFGIE